MMLGLAVMFTAFSGVTGAILNANNKFFIVGGGTLIFNVSVIVFIYFESLDEVAGLNWFCIGVAVGALIRLVTQLFSISRATYTGFQRGWLLTAGFVKLFIYGLASTALLVTLPIIVRSGISIFGEGHLSIFNYSLKLVELPNAIFISSVLIVAYPKLCSAIQKKDSAKMHDLIHKNITKLFAISFVIFLVGASYSDLIVNFLFGQSPISQDDLKKISAFTQIGFSSIPFVAIGGFFMALINALGYSKYVLLYSFYAAILTSLIVMFGYQFRSQNLLVLSLPLAHLFLSALCYQFLRKNSYVFGHIFKKCIKTMILLCIMFYFFWEFEVYVYSKLMQLTDGFYLLIMRLLCISFIFLSLISVGLFLNRGGLNGEKTV
jgi:peptidoglycan biosynthesis protein MviN/MurJ (putative lipid II flippase)